MKKFIAATRNRGKIKEISEVLDSLPLQVVSMEEAGVNKEIEETGSTFEENALIKAREVCKLTGETVMADDSGLEVDYLNGAPGIYSSRYAGENATDDDRIRKLLDELGDVDFENRRARFVCAIAVVLPEGEEFVVRSTCEGFIAMEPAGENGFGYDPVFFLEEYAKTMAELEPEQKNEVSHRGKALKLMLKELECRG